MRETTVYHELGPDFFGHVDTFIGSVYELFGLVNIADAAADADAGGYPQLAAEYIVSEDRPHRPRRHEVLRADGRDGGEARRLGSDRAVANGDIVEADDDIASAGAAHRRLRRADRRRLEGMGSPE